VTEWRPSVIRVDVLPSGRASGFIRARPAEPGMLSRRRIVARAISAIDARIATRVSARRDRLARTRGKRGMVHVRPAWCAPLKARGKGGYDHGNGCLREETHGAGG